MPNPSIEELIKTARELNEKNAFSQLIDLLPQKTVAEHGNAELAHELAAAFVGRANILLQDADYDRAISDMTRAIKLEPGNSEYHFIRAKLHGLYKYADEAIKGLSKAIELAPHSDEYFYTRGLIYNKEKRYTEAIADFDQAIALNPGHAVAYIERASAWYNTKEYDKSISDLSRSIEITPDIAAAWHNRGGAWYDKKEYDKGIADLSQAILLDPNNAVSYMERGLNYEAKKEYDNAIADYTRVISLDSLWIPPWCHRGDAWKEKKEYHNAIDDYNEVISMKPRYPGVHYKKGVACYEAGEYYGAFISLKRALELKSEDKEAGKWLTKAEAKLREMPDLYEYLQSIRDEAASFIEQIVKDYSKKFKTHNDGFVHREGIRKWDPVKECPAWAGIIGWLPAFRPDLAKWEKSKNPYGFESVEVYTQVDTVFNPQDAGIPISEELWDAITGKGYLPEFDEDDIGFVRKFDNVAPMLKRIAARIRSGNLDPELVFGLDEDDDEEDDDNDGDDGDGMGEDE